MKTSECNLGQQYPSVNIIIVSFGVSIYKLAHSVRLAPIRLEVKSTKEYKQGGTPLHLYSLTQVVLQEREELVCQKEVRSSSLGFTLLQLRSILRKFCGVLSLVVSPRKIFVFLCFCACCFFSDILVIICFKISSKKIVKT